MNAGESVVSGSGLAPIVLFVYKRPEHTRQMIESLRSCPEFNDSPVYVFADGPKTHADEAEVEATREVVKELVHGRSLLRFSERNIGLAASVINGINEVLERYESIIVIEDDLVVSPRFLTYMNRSLQRYAHEPRVMQISGFMYEVKPELPSDEALFLEMFSTWGWGTWARAWSQFDTGAKGWRQLLRSPTSRWNFDLEGQYPLSRMLEKQMTGKADSWGIRWYYSLRKAEGLVLFPPKTLVQNTGFDGSGVHHSFRASLPQSSLATDISFAMPATVSLSPLHGRVYRSMMLGLWHMRAQRVLEFVKKKLSVHISNVDG